MSKRICSVEGCERPVKARGYCNAHYLSLRESGDLVVAERPVYGREGCVVDGCSRSHKTHGYCGFHWNRVWRGQEVDAPQMRAGNGSRPAKCEYPDCDRAHFGLGFCSMHYKRAVKGAPMDAPKWGTDDSITYGGAHDRVEAKRGKAALQRCVDCGGPASEWSYNGGCGAEMIGSNGRSDCAYCPHPDHYEPRCASCHRRYDAA